MKLKSFLKPYRVTDWIHYLGFYLVGFFSNSGYLTNNSFPIGLLTCSLLLSYGFCFNHIFESKEKRKVILQSLIPLLILFPFLRFSPLLPNLIVALFLLLVTIYSLPSVGLKKIPFVNLLVNTLGFGLLHLFGAVLASNKLGLDAIIFLTILCLFQSASELIHQLEHKELDLAFNVRNTAFILGPYKSKKLIKLLSLIGCLVSLHYLREVASFFLVSLPTLLFTIQIWKKIDIEKIGTLRKEFRKRGSLVGFSYMVFLLIKKM